MKLLTQTLRQKVKRHEGSRYAISQATGIDQAALLRFLEGGDMRGKSLDKLAVYFGLELRPVEDKPKQP